MASPTPLEVLSAALVDALDAGLIVPCVGDGRWVSEDYRERAEAAELCEPCPIWDACSAYAHARPKPSFGVYAGEDLAPKATRRTA